MKDYSKILTYEEINKLLIDLSAREIYPEVVPGSLLDNLFFDDMKLIKFNSVKPRKYWMILEEYVNEWSSQYKFIMTDNDEKFQKTFEDYKTDYKNSLEE